LQGWWQKQDGRDEFLAITEGFKRRASACQAEDSAREGRAEAQLGGQMPHALKPRGVRIPRGLPNHKTHQGKLYRDYILALIERLGPLPASAQPTLREAALNELELQYLAGELEAARRRKRRVEMRRLRRQIFAQREQALRLVAHLEALAAAQPKPASFAAAIRGAR
jgi:hypothetical protein